MIESEAHNVNECETCAYYAYDEDWDCWVCEMNLDEDEYARYISDARAHCPYYRDGDEYRIARKQ